MDVRTFMWCSDVVVAWLLSTNFCNVEWCFRTLLSDTDRDRTKLQPSVGSSFILTSYSVVLAKA